MTKIPVAILGSGNVGSDLTERLLRDNKFEVVALVGRNKDSEGLKRFQDRVPLLIPDGISGLSGNLHLVDGLFDATSSRSAEDNWKLAHQNNKWLIDLTPSKLGTAFIPSVSGQSSGIDLSESFSHNYSMVTCGGQASAPIVQAITSHMQEVKRVEVSSSIAAKSAGKATRDNIDKYIETTEQLVSQVGACPESKAILVLNPSVPEVPMRTTVTVSGFGGIPELIARSVYLMVDKMKSFVPGYELIGDMSILDKETYTATIRVSGAGYFLPSYAGNLDIINAAAVATALMHSAKHNGGK